MDTLTRPCANDFIEARQYLKDVTPATLLWYQRSFKIFDGCETATDYMKRIKALKERGMSAVSINTYLRTINAFLHWQVQPNKKCSPACEHLKFARLKEEKKIIEAFSVEQVAKLLTTKPQCANERRIQALAALLLDTGMRIQEAVKLRREQCDLEAMLIKPMGKGKKERMLPLSTEGRRRLYLWLKSHHSPYVFTTSTGTHMSIRNAQRDLDTFCQRVGITDVRTSPHTLRHTFATMYLRNGGNVEYLRRVLGHTNILTTQRYLQSLGHEDLGKVHNALSPLAAL